MQQLRFILPLTQTNRETEWRTILYIANGSKAIAKNKTQLLHLVGLISQ
jgi:hypothetical protein